VVEAPRVESQDREKEFESMASEGLEGHLGGRQPGDGETEGRTEGARLHSVRFRQLRVKMNVSISRRERDLSVPSSSHH
jgi:hypothetical protein